MSSHDHASMFAGTHRATFFSCAVLALLCTTSLLAATPSHQQAIVQHGAGGPEVLKLESIPVLAPAKGEVLIRVYAAAINPVDWKRRKGGGDYAMDPNGLPTMIPGGDVAGVIEKVGEGSVLRRGFLQQGLEALAALEEPEPLHVLVQALELGGTHADTAVRPSAS